jgi:hypothetical protein
MISTYTMKLFMGKMGEISPKFEKINKISMSPDFNYKFQ